jgi:hypothetical protein
MILKQTRSQNYYRATLLTSHRQDLKPREVLNITSSSIYYASKASTMLRSIKKLAIDRENCDRREELTSYQ